MTAGLTLRGWVLHSGNTYKITISDHVSTSIATPTAIYENGTALTLQASIAAVDANAGSYFIDAGVIYVQAHSSPSLVHLRTYVATIPFRFSNKPRATDTHEYYEPYFEAAPSLSLRIEPRFSGVGQIGSGTCRLIAADNYFDELHRKLEWDFGTVVFKMGADVPQQTGMALADFETVGTWKIERAELTDKQLVLSLRELKTNLEREIPFETYSQTDYPSLDRADVGKVIPRAYGKIFGAKPVLIDPGTKEFKLAGHAIYDILEVRVKGDDGIWDVVNVASRDLANAEFTLGVEWDNGLEVSVDFIGMTLDDGRPMYNPADIVQDVLEYIGESSFDGFTEAFNYFDIGQQNNGLRRTHMKPSLYIKDTTRAGEIIGTINEHCGTFLFVNANGEFHFGASKPKPLDLVDGSFSKIDILQDSLTDDVDASKLFTKVICNYAKREQDGYAQTIERSRGVNRYAHSPLSEIIETKDAALWDEEDAEYFAERLLTQDATPLRKYRFEIPWQAFFILPGNNLHLSYAPKSIDTVVEVIEVRHDLTGGKVQGVGINRRGWNDSMGFWVADSQAAWSAGDSDAVKLTNRQSSGFWTGDDDLAVSTDGKSSQTSRWW